MWNATGLTDKCGTLYAGTGGAGVFKSTDGGTTWSAAGLSGNRVFALAIDPTTPSTLYAGTNAGVLGIHRVLVTPTPTNTPTPIDTPTPTPPPCVGDCDGSGDVTVNELIIMVNIALRNTPLSACMAGDADGSGDITINEIIAAVNHVLNGCAAT
jgi:hypothetical protein